MVAFIARLASPGSPTGCSPSWLDVSRPPPSPRKGPDLRDEPTGHKLLNRNVRSGQSGSVECRPRGGGPVSLTSECHADGIVLSSYGLSSFAKRWQRDDAATLGAFDRPGA